MPVTAPERAEAAPGGALWAATPRGPKRALPAFLLFLILLVAPLAALSEGATPEPVYPESLQVAASIEPNLMVAPEIVHLTITLTNAGDSPIADIRILRPNGSLVENIGTLGPGESRAHEEQLQLSLEQFRDGGATYLVHCTLNPGTVNETGGRMTVKAPLERIEAMPDVEFSRSVSSEYVQAGEQVSLTYRVMNTGNVPLIDIVVSDPLTGDVGGLAELGPGQKHTFTTRVTVTSDAESLPTLICYSKADPEVPIERDLGATRIRVTDQRLEAVLSADQAAVRSGESVTLRLTLFNASDIACERLRVTDQNGGELDSPPFSLKPGERYELTQSVQMRETTTFLLTVSGRTEGGSAISARSNPLTVAVQAADNRARVALSAQVNPNTPVPPGTVRFSIRLNNTGEDALHCVKLSEQSRGAIRTLWVVPPGETVIEQDYPIGGKPFVFLAEMADEKGGRLTVLSAPIAVEAAAQPQSASAAPTPLPTLAGPSYRLSGGVSTFLKMMIGAVSVLAILIAIIAVNGVRKRKRIEKQRRIHIKRIRRSMKSAQGDVSQETRHVPVVRRDGPDSGA
jgi:uncharacterized repeat protein (TIGR01451 family)